MTKKKLLRTASFIVLTCFIGQNANAFIEQGDTVAREGQAKHLDSSARLQKAQQGLAPLQGESNTSVQNNANVNAQSSPLTQPSNIPTPPPLPKSISSALTPKNEQSLQLQQIKSQENSIPSSIPEVSKPSVIPLVPTSVIPVPPEATVYANTFRTS